MNLCGRNSLVVGLLKSRGKTEKQQKGAFWERHAESFLKSQGLNLLYRNFTCRLGEIDLVMVDGDMLVFVEVRFRNSQRLGSGAETIQHVKQMKVSRAAGIFLSRHAAWSESTCRFDVVSISMAPGGPETTWIRNAFDSLV